MTSTTELVASTKGYVALLHRVADKAEKIRRTAAELQSQASNIIRNLDAGLHIGHGYSNQTLTEAASEVAAFEELINLAGSIGEDANDLDILNTVVSDPKMIWKVTAR